MTGIHQVLAGASSGDAITNSALEIREDLRRIGPSEIYARHISRDIEGDVLRLEKFPRGSTGDVMIYHASIGEPLVHAFLLSRREPLVVVYHNVTPSHYYERWDPVFAELLDLGRRELFDLRHRVTAAVADSSFNAGELRAMGYENVQVVPPVIDPYRLKSVEPTAATLNHLDNALGAPFFLYVGQLLPHKRPDLLVEAMHLATTYAGIDAMLLLVGHHRLPSYTGVIIEMIRELNLSNVHVVGHVPTAELAAFYSRAIGVVTASEHEGFCVPLLEAMAFGVPTLARAYGAVPETISDGGLLLPPDDDPALFAEALDAIAGDRATHDDLSRRASRRVSDFDADRSRADLFSVLLEAV